ncbi:MAG: ATP-binding protein [Ezakiella sp.]|nr:ATP-binding protein [Ezakiella sp.]
MKKKIYNNFSLLIVIAILLTAIAISFVFYNSHKTTHETRLKNILDFLSKLPEEEEIFDQAKRSFPGMRLTLIDKEGTVLYDSDKWAEDMGDHDKREEVIEARAKGTGSAVRYSETMHENYYYYAQALNDGSVLRISEMQTNIFRTFQKIIWPVALIVLVALFLTFILGNIMTNSIISDLKIQVEGIAGGTTDTPMYRELYPVRRLIEDQREDINSKIDNLEDYQNTIEAILSNMSEGMLFIDDVNRIVLVNRRALILLDKDTSVNYIDRSVLYLTRDENFMAALSTDRTYLRDRVILDINDTKVRADITPVRGKGEFIGKIIVLSDVTKEIVLEQERREFTSNVAHELKTPLTSINGYAELLSIGKVEGKDVKNIGSTIFEEGKRILRLIESMLNLSKIEEQDEIPEEDFDIKDIVEKTLDLYQLKAEEKGMRLEKDLISIPYTGSKELIEEIVYNLIDNAYKYGIEGGYIKTRLVPRDGYFIFSVEDDGIGISEKDKDKIFQRFYTVDVSRHRRDSSGIGLSIVKHGIEKLGGKIYLESREGRGTTFTVEIPM